MITDTMNPDINASFVDRAIMIYEAAKQTSWPIKA